MIILKNKSTSRYTLINVNSIKNLQNIEGNEYIYSLYEDRSIKRKFSFYNLTSIKDCSKYLSEKFCNKIDLVESVKLPFNIEKKQSIMIITDENGKLKPEIQLSYFKNKESSIGEEFFIATISENKDNPLKTIKNDGYFLNENQSLLKIKKDYAYKYYFYDDNNNKIQIIITGANELYAYDDGLIYHFAYSINNFNEDKEKQMIELIKSAVFMNSETK